MNRNHRERLIEAAKQCLAEKGYANTTARDLVAASGTNLASIGYHFGSKEKLLNTALLHGYQTWLAPVLQRERPETSNSTFIATGIRTYLAAFEQEGAMSYACYEAIAQSQHSAEIRSDLQGVYRTIRDRITTEMEASTTLNPTQSRTIATLLMALADGLALQRLLDPADTPDLEGLDDSLLQLAQTLTGGNAREKIAEGRGPSDQREAGRPASAFQGQERAEG
ncbi:TetR/AcrR family transcriptional regulator [Deinococcus roseus]|uniref:Transcriptional regulator n=1 Tax=Deinococcus roseus TaxID=392414 RepID=A0ABQ2DI39_9DEIO|nr:TetR/AcrR family transcriptional regulator [Deinococcus roseus]GGJ57965.1 transcriptional regulator [Deinococcus roseus]